MNQILIDVAHKIGMDKSIAYSSGSRFIGGVTGVLSVFFISTFLSGVEQGFYYTFGSLLALQVFFELGLTGIMTQYVAHEVSHLTLNGDNQYEGEERYKSRLASLVRFCVKWYTVTAILVFLFLLITGFVYFNHYGGGDADVSWQMPWLLLCLATAVKLFQSPFMSIYMGLGKVKEMSEIGFWQQVMWPATLWIGLVCGLKLYVLGVGYVLSVIGWQIYVRCRKLDMIVINLWKTNITDRVVYSKEIFPYQWRIALSWVSGYFVFQLFNPVLFATEGPVIAGQMGMTLQGLNAIQALAGSWLNTKVPLFSQLIALKDYIQLDQIFNRTKTQMVAVCSILLAAFFLLIWSLNITHIKIGDTVMSERFLGLLPMILMIIPVFMQQYINCWAVYIRCHKKEPFMIISICMAIACCISTLLLGKLYGLYGITIGYCMIYIIFFPWWYSIYRTKKIEWHSRGEQ